MRATRIQKFIVQDVGFWGNGKILSRRESLNTLLEADSATITILNHKNGIMGQTLHQKSTGIKGDVEDLARRVYHILRNKGT